MWNVSALAQVFIDTFEPSASPAWGNERGDWYASNGVYNARQPANSPLTYSSITALPDLVDFTVDINIRDVDDGGVFLRSTFTENGISGVLLVTGGWGHTGSSLYWHIVQNDSVGAPLAEATLPGFAGSDTHLRITVVGDTYSVFVNGAAQPATVFRNSMFTSGRVALYDYSGFQSTDRIEVYGDVRPPVYPTLIGLEGGTDNPRLLAIDSYNAAAMPIGYIGVGVGWNSPGLAYNPWSNELYAVNGGLGSDVFVDLVSIDPTNGSGRVVGSLGIPVSGPDLAFDPFSRTLYLVSALSNSLYAVAWQTGQATFLAHIPNATNNCGLAFNTETRTLFCASGQEVLEVDPVKGFAVVATNTLTSRLTGLTYSPKRRMLFGADATAPLTSLCSIDSSNVVTAIGNIPYANVDGLTCTYDALDLHPDFRIVAVNRANGNDVISWNTVSGLVYVVQSTPLLDSSWTNSSLKRVGSGQIDSFTNSAPVPPVRYYRGLISP
jgi:hypothetical protein